LFAEGLNPAVKLRASRQKQIKNSLIS